MKKFIYIFIIFALSVALSSCSKTRAYHYNIIKEAYDADMNNVTMEKLIEYLGEPTEVAYNTPDMFYNCYYWYNGASSMKDAKEKVESGKKIYYIGVKMERVTRKIVGLYGGYVDENSKLGGIGDNA